MRTDTIWNKEFFKGFGMFLAAAAGIYFGGMFLHWFFNLN
jgi:hypothetical protein